MAKKELITLIAVGDVCVDREEPDSIFAYVAPVIKSADITFCQLEAIYSEKGAPQPHSRVPMRAHPRNAPAFGKAGFQVISFASNHTMDWGADAALDTLNLMQQTGVHIIGVGKNIEEARKPYIMECKGTKVAFLAYCSILPMGHWAEANRAGSAPARGWTFYEQIEHDQPGTPARIHSFAHEDDKAAMIKDINNVKTQADLVMVSMHWGIHFKEAEIAAYQKEYAYAAIDAGADVILGHHAHILKPIEVYKGKPIFYSLCNFAFDLHLPDYVLNSYRWKELMAINPSWTMDPRYKAYPFPADSRMTMIVKILISDKKISKVSFLPVLVNEDSQPRVLTQKDKEFGNILKYMEKITKDQKLDTKYIIEGDEILASD
jgi:poly-gamma-glutamate capsule biosynthesis protein CapA/YwtB (metallophosphatase superfamily)